MEINNTDAEGRLVLGDGVAYASQVLAPGLIVDMATLTGAQLVATGKRHAAVVSNCEATEAAAVAAGRASGDLVGRPVRAVPRRCQIRSDPGPQPRACAPSPHQVHALPFCPEFYRPEFASKVADMKNSVKDRSNAQSSCAANFVYEHLAEGYTGRWLHVDMAGPAWQERGTGYGVALLLQLLALPGLQQ